MLELTMLLVLLALLFTIISAIGKLPLWPAVLMLVLLHLVAGIR